MKKILVTGGAGFVGSALCKKLLDLGHEVFSLDNYFTGSTDNHHPGVKYFTGHTRDIGKLFGQKYKFDLIYHLGEYSRVEKSFEDPLGLVWDLNTAGTFSVLEFWKKTGAKLIYSGSSTKFAQGADGETGSTMSPYAWSKAANTELVKNYAKWFDLQYAITYFYNVYGEREISEGPYSTIVGIFTKQYEKNLPFTVVKPGEQKRNFTHIDDIVDALILVGEKGEGDEFGIGSAESFSVKELAEMFRQPIIWMPERKGNRLTADVLTEKTKLLGWEQKRNLKLFIENKIQKINENKKENSQSEKIKNRILVFATTFFPEQGLCEQALFELIKKVPDIHFDVITTNIGVDESVKFPENLHIYRIGENSLKDKNKLMFNGYKLAEKLAQENNYAFVWSVMATYGTWPAYKIKKQLQIPLLITLGDQKIPTILNPKYWLFKFFISGGDQISTNSVFEENISRTFNLNWLKTVNKKGDTFSNAFRFAYNMIFAEVYKNNKNNLS